MATAETWVCRTRKCDFVYESPIKLTACAHEYDDLGKKIKHDMKKENE